MKKKLYRIVIGGKTEYVFSDNETKAKKFVLKKYGLPVCNKKNLKWETSKEEWAWLNLSAMETDYYNI